MFQFFRFLKSSKVPKEDAPIFCGNAIIDVTNFSTTSPTEPLGYFCSCDISVFANGQIEIRADDGAKELLERFSVLDITSASNNVNNYDPSYATMVSVTTNAKNLRVTFQSKDPKEKFWNALTTTYDKLNRA